MERYQHLFHVFIIAILLISTKINSMNQPLKFTILKHTFVQSRKDPQLFNSDDDQFCLIDRDFFILVRQYEEPNYQLYYNKVLKKTTFSHPTLHEDTFTDDSKSEVDWAAWQTLHKFLDAYKKNGNY